MSRPSTRAVPDAGLWKPSRVLMSVDLPAPLGPSSPMDTPVSAALSLLRMTRCPKRTSRPSSSMTGCINNLSIRHLALACSFGLKERRQRTGEAGDVAAHQAGDARSDQVRIGGHGEAFRFGVGGYESRLHVAEAFERWQLFTRALRYHAAEQAGDGRNR